MTSIVGIDIAKEKFDVCLLDDGGQAYHESLANTKSGINRLQRWLKKRGAKTAHICLEVTGIYGDLLAETMHQRGYTVSVVNQRGSKPTEPVRCSATRPTRWMRR